MSATTNGHATPGAFLDQIAGGAQVAVRDEEWLVRAVQHTCGCASTRPATNTTCSVPVSNSVPCSRSPHRNAPTSAPLCLMPVGLRGVGKTVLINRFCEIAADEGLQVGFIEAPETGDFRPRRTSPARSTLHPPI